MDPTEVLYVPEDKSEGATGSDIESQAHSALPPFDRALTTRNLSIFGILTCGILASCCMAAGLYCNYRTIPHSNKIGIGYILSLNISGRLQVVMSLLFSFLVSLSTDCIGYVHSVSLRWALWHDHRLEYNSNLRLLTSVRSSFMNRWPVNVVSIAALTVSYAAASQFSASGETDLLISGTALLYLGSSLLALTLISALCIILQWRRILTWSSGTLTTALACRHNSLRRREGRCSLAAGYSETPAELGTPHVHQPAMKTTGLSVRSTTYLVWVLAFLGLSWGVTISVVKGIRPKFTTINANGPQQALAGRREGVINTEGGVDLWEYGVSETERFRELNSIQYSCNLAFIVILQSMVTIGIHCVELIVNRSRDQAAWARLACRTGWLAQHSFRKPRVSSGQLGSTKDALTSWQNIVLFILKSLLHFLFNRAAGFFDLGSGSVIMAPEYIFSLVAVWIIMAIFATILAYRKPKTAQPATWGHLQTLADLIDDWGEGKSLWWGDKGELEEGIRYAGTSSRRQDVGPIRMDCLYGAS